jgi:peptide/nickel transport system ATP-binding protein
LIDSAPDPDRIAAHANGAGVAEDGIVGEDATDEGALDEGTAEVASLIRPPSGCRFHPRCPHAMQVCGAQVPPRFTVGETREGERGHWAACWLYSPEHRDEKAGATQ